jgi:hypothetical protein
MLESKTAVMTRRLRRRMKALGTVAALAAWLLPAASSAATLNFLLSPGPVGSHIRPYDGYPTGNYTDTGNTAKDLAMILDVDTSALTVTLSSFWMPDPPAGFGIDFDIIQNTVPASITGSLVALGGSMYRINLNPIQVGFIRDDGGGDFQGTLTLALTTGDVSVTTAGGCGRNQTFTEGIDLDLSGGIKPLTLVAAVCPYTGFFNNNPSVPLTFSDSPYRMFLIGTVPEPGTFMLVATGLLGMTWLGRPRVRR